MDHMDTQQVLAAWQTPQTPSHRQALPHRDVPSFLCENTQRQMGEQIAKGLSTSWSIPCVVAPLSEREIQFLKNHTVDEIISRPPAIQEGTNGVINFLVGVVTAVIAQVTTEYVLDLIRPDNPLVKADEMQEEDNDDLDSSFEGLEEQKPEQGLESLSKGDPAQRVHSLAKEQFSESIELDKSHKPIAVPKKMQKYVYKHVLKKSLEKGEEEIAKRIKDLYKETADQIAQEGVDRMKKEVGHMSDSSIKALRHKLRTEHAIEGEQVSGFVKNYIRTVANGAVFLHKVYESKEELRDAILDTLKDQTTNQWISKTVSLGCSLAPEIFTQAICRGMGEGFKEFMASPELNAGEDQLIAREKTTYEYCKGVKQLDAQAECPILPSPSFVPSQLKASSGSHLEVPDLYSSRQPTEAFCSIM